MRMAMIFGSLLLTSGLVFAASDQQVRTGKTTVPTPVPPAFSAMQTAQNCGYFAILGCFKSYGEAENWNNKIESGHVINTTSAEYPAFRAGFYCVAHGPTSQGAAQSVMRGWRKYVPDAYVKNSC